MGKICPPQGSNWYKISPRRIRRVRGWLCIPVPDPHEPAPFRPCLVPKKFCKIFQISHHIESLDICMEY